MMLHEINMIFRAMFVLHPIYKSKQYQTASKPQMVYTATHTGASIRASHQL